MLVVWPHMCVVRAIIYLGLVITQILSAGVVAYLDHALGFLTRQQEIVLVHCKRLLMFDGVVGDISGGGVIAVDGGRRLWVTKFLER